MNFPAEIKKAHRLRLAELETETSSQEEPRMQNTQTLHDRLRCALSIIQVHILALEGEENGKATFGGSYMPTQSLEYAAQVIYEALPVADAAENE